MDGVRVTKEAQLSPRDRAMLCGILDLCHQLWNYVIFAIA